MQYSRYILYDAACMHHGDMVQRNKARRVPHRVKHPEAESSLDILFSPQNISEIHIWHVVHVSMTPCLYLLLSVIGLIHFMVAADKLPHIEHVNMCFKVLKYWRSYESK